MGLNGLFNGLFNAFPEARIRVLSPACLKGSVLSTLPGSSSVLPVSRFDAIADAVRAPGDVDGVRRSVPRRYYHRELIRLLRLNIPVGARVLQVGCGTADLLAGVEPGRGVGIEPDADRAARSRRGHPDLEIIQDRPETFVLDETFDYVILGDAIGELEDVQACLERIATVCTSRTRVILTYYSALWEPILRAAGWLRLRRRTRDQNWLNTNDLSNLLDLAGFDVIKCTQEMLVPIGVPFVSKPCNRVLARIWPTRHLALVRMLVARVAPTGTRDDSLTCSVIIPTRNERGNIEAAVRRTPRMGAHTELIFVDGASRDGTPREIERVMAAYPDTDIRLIHQGDGRGKGDAVRKGFAAARGDVLMILDADLTVPPEDLPKFFDAIATGKGEFINGTRLVYPIPRDAMRVLNQAANGFFSTLFTWLLGQRFRDTLCGTKVLRREDYATIAANRATFGDFDPFGDFDLIFGAARANLKIVEIPIRYRARTYGTTNIRRFLHGLILLRMSLVALVKLKLR